jgi:dipeptidyl aminopeptidase/acylaminoacyl peptidase
MLVNYKSPKGERLQAGLLLPANYQKGKSYPTIVDVYEKNSPKINRFYTPSSWFSRAVFNSHGYAILAPDIVYELNNSGICAVKCILAAIEAAVETGIVDKDRLGITGHSWGGYETAFIITQTDIFKAAIAGAPLINLFGLYNSIYGSTGDANQRYFESSQDRAKGPYWQYFDDYYRNSPVFFAPNVKTPLMILHNDKDKAVDFHQGIEYFNALRYLQKPVILLQYKGEGHALRKYKNSLDYGVRMLEFFDHYLKGKPPPEWLQKGIPYLKRQEHMEKRAKRYFEKK